MMASFRNGSMMCGGSTGISVSFTPEMRVRGETRTVARPSGVPGGVVRRRAIPPTFSRYSVCPG